jgi:hypothetical protein
MILFRPERVGKRIRRAFQTDRSGVLGAQLLHTRVPGRRTVPRGSASLGRRKSLQRERFAVRAMFGIVRTLLFQMAQSED